MVQKFAQIPRTLKRPALIHMGIHVTHTMDSWVEAARKLRLMPLSFLASQDLQNTKLFFWTNVDRSHPLIQELFPPIVEQYGKYTLRSKKIDAKEQFKQVALEYTDFIAADVMESA